MHLKGISAGVHAPAQYKLNGPDYSVMLRASASGTGGRGFDQGPRHSKDVNGTSVYLLGARPHGASTGYLLPKK